MTDASQDRAGHLNVLGPPLVRFGGRQSVSAGGGPEDAEALLDRYRTLVDTALAVGEQPGTGIDAQAWLEAGVVHLAATARGNGLRLHAVLVERTLVFPGQNDLLFHHHVARASLTPRGGVPTDAAWSTTLGLADLAAALDATFSKLIEQRNFPIRPPLPSADNLAIVLFLEDPDSGVIPQALSIRVGPKPKTP